MIRKTKRFLRRLALRKGKKHKPGQPAPSDAHVSRRRFIKGVGVGMGAFLCARNMKGVMLPSGQMVVPYEAHKGESVEGIASAFGCDKTDLKELNEIKQNVLAKDQTLHIPMQPPARTLALEEVSEPGMAPPLDEPAMIELARPPQGLDEARLMENPLTLCASLFPGWERDPAFNPVDSSRIKVSNLDAGRWKHVILHHSGTVTGNAMIFDRYHREERHMPNGLAYHFVIGNGSKSGDGEVEIGGRWLRQIQGGHVRSDALNQNSIGICMVGDFEQFPPTSKQIAACIELVDLLKNLMLQGQPRLLLHREVQMTDCPGRYFPGLELHRLFA